jgi:hypothetical protein
MEHGGSQMGWLKVCLAKQAHQQTQHSQFLSFTLPQAMYYMLLGWGGWSIACCISLLVDFTNSQHHLYNH